HDDRLENSLRRRAFAPDPVSRAELQNSVSINLRSRPADSGARPMSYGAPPPSTGHLVPRCFLPMTGDFKTALGSVSTFATFMHRYAYDFSYQTLHGQTDARLFA